jgi:hypothetical protein
MNSITRITTAAVLGLGLTALGTAAASADTRDEHAHVVVDGGLILDLDAVVDLDLDLVVDLCANVVDAVDADVDAVVDAGVNIGS